MAGWNGAGVFLKTYSWVADAANGIKILASRHDQNDIDFTNGINNCITKDGQNAATANLPMGTFKHTNVGNATARTQYLSMGQYQDQSGKYYTSTGTANTYAVTASPAITAYSSGQSFCVNFHVTNTGTSTVNINTLGAKSLVKNGSVAMTSGDIIANAIYTIVYNGTNFQVLNYNISTTAIIDDYIDGVASATIATGDKVLFKDITDSDALKTDTVLGILKLVYPVGSYYLNESDSTNPSTLLGFGTWTAVTDKFIVARGSTYTSTGGAATVTLTTNELPAHAHTAPAKYYNSASAPAGNNLVNTSFFSAGWNGGAPEGTVTVSSTNSAGSGAAFSIIPTYQAAYIWKRTV